MSSDGMADTDAFLLTGISVRGVKNLKLALMSGVTTVATAVPPTTWRSSCPRRWRTG
jgi:hypothetical protein